MEIACYLPTVIFTRAPQRVAELAALQVEPVNPGMLMLNKTPGTTAAVRGGGGNELTTTCLGCRLQVTVPADQRMQWYF